MVSLFVPHFSFLLCLSGRGGVFVYVAGGGGGGGEGERAGGARAVLHDCDISWVC